MTGKSLWIHVKWPRGTNVEVQIPDIYLLCRQTVISGNTCIIMQMLQNKNKQSIYWENLHCDCRRYIGVGTCTVTVEDILDWTGSGEVSKKKQFSRSLYSILKSYQKYRVTFNIIRSLHTTGWPPYCRASDLQYYRVTSNSTGWSPILQGVLRSNSTVWPPILQGDHQYYKKPQMIQGDPQNYRVTCNSTVWPPILQGDLQYYKGPPIKQGGLQNYSLTSIFF